MVKIEELVHPGADDVTLDIAGMLTDDGIVASMCVVGEKARFWERRDRQDVITAVGQHDVGLHIDLQSVHPTVSEYLADKGWTEGVTEALWFAGQLCYHTFIGLPGGEDACCDGAIFETALPKLLQQVEERQQRGFPCVGLFAGHPTHFRFTVLWDELNFRRGQNLAPDEYRFAPRRDDADFFRQFFQTRRRQQSLFSR